MTPSQQRAWDAKICALTHEGVGMPERVERARRELAAEATARAEPEPPDSGPRIVAVGEVRTEAKTNKPRVDSSKTRKRAEAKTEERNPRTRTAGKDAKTMTAVHAKRVSDADRGTPSGSEPQSDSGLKIAEEESAPDPKLNGQDRDRQPIESVLPEVVDAVLAAPHFRVTVRTWRRWDSAGVQDRRQKAVASRGFGAVVQLGVPEPRRLHSSSSHRGGRP